MTPRERAVVATVATRHDLRRATLDHVPDHRRYAAAVGGFRQTARDIAHAFATLRREAEAAVEVAG